MNIRTVIGYSGYHPDRTLVYSLHTVGRTRTEAKELVLTVEFDEKISWKQARQKGWKVVPIIVSYVVPRATKMVGK